VAKELEQKAAVEKEKLEVENRLKKQDADLKETKDLLSQV
jgi:hypothetical protein